MILQRLLIGDGAHGVRNVGITLVLFLPGGFDIFSRNHGYEFAVIAVGQAGARSGVPKIKTFGFTDIQETLVIGKMLFQEVRQGGQNIAIELLDLQITGGLVVRQAVIAFEIVSASAVGIVPAERLVHVISRERSGRPVVSVGAGFGIHEETIEQTEAVRQRVMIGGHDLPRAIRTLRGSVISEDRKAGLSIGGISVAGRFHIAKHLIVGAIFLDDIDDVLDRAVSCKKFWGSEIHQAVILHGLLGVMRQRRAVRQGKHADISGDNRAAVLATLAVLFFVRGKRGVGRIWRATAVVHAHGR